MNNLLVHVFNLCNNYSFNLKSTNNMKNSSKILLAMGAGALIGGVSGYLLNSDKGRKARSKAAKNIRQTADEATEKINSMVETAQTAIGEFAGQAKKYMGNLTGAAEEKLEEAKKKTKAMAANSTGAK